jgi:hypothetical protein
MKTCIKKIAITGFVILASAVVFTISINDSSIDSLRANATREGTRCKCVQAANHDCRFGSSIMVGYKVQCTGGDGGVD